MRPPSLLQQQQQCSNPHAPTSAVSLLEHTTLHRYPVHSAHAPSRHTISAAPQLRKTGRRGGRRLLQPLAATQSKEEFRYLQVELPPPINSRVTKSAFTKSSSTVKDCPADNMPEIAAIGRSNVGKSSLINCLTGNDKLAKVSKTPGMTKLINHFLINDSWYLVDLPGYGFAKTASKDSRSEWLAFTKDYFIKRDVLAHVLLLVDGSLPPQQVDVDCVNWLAECQVPFAIVFTKMDQRKKGSPSPAQNVRAFKRMLIKDWEELPWCFETSGKTGMGKSELLGYIASINEMYRRSGGE